MKKYLKNDLENLADIFAAWMGGYPTETEEIKSFLTNTGLEGLLFVPDIERIFFYYFFLSKEAATAVYALLPLKLKLKDIELNLFPQSFNRLNIKTSRQKGSGVLNTRIEIAYKIKEKYYAKKIQFITENKDKLRYQNQKAKHPEQLKATAQNYLNNLSEEQKAQRRDKARLRMQKYRQEHPESIKKVNQKAQAQKTELQKISERINARKRGKEYRQNNKEKIAAKNKAYRELKKAENPELYALKEREYNLSEGHKKSSQKYYETHKDEIAQKAKDNPKTKLYKQKYKAKKRFQQKTGAQILSLLQSILNSKTR